MIRNLIILLIVIIASLIFLFMISQKEHALTKLKIGETELEVEISDTLVKQVQGLSGRESLCENCGMLFVFGEKRERTFIMRGMKFPLDMIFIREGRVVEIKANIPYPEAGESPLSVPSREEADMVLEVNAGYATTHRIQTGDTIKLD